MYHFITFILQSSVLGDLRTESEGDSIWDNPITAIMGVALFGYLIYDYLKSKK